jgi:Uncharacterized lipoprotein NlpE involved in copper resistance
MKKGIILLCIAVTALSACNSGKRASNAPTNEAEAIALGDNSRNSLDWAGVYRGTLPCADCSGIEVEIRLNEDLSYERVMSYLGKGDNRYPDNGRFEWDETGSRIKLTSTSSPDATDNWFLVGENKLIALDIEGNRIESNFPPEIYFFEKLDRDNVVTEKYWKLIELAGKEITSSPEGQNREAHFILKNEDKRVTGNTGCNNMNGTYQLSGEENTIRFSPLATTRMACIGIDYEYEYLKVFEICDNYTIQNDTLSLNKEGTGSLARFAAVYLR